MSRTIKSHKKRVPKTLETPAVTWPDVLGPFRAHLISAERRPTTIDGYLRDCGRFAAWCQAQHLGPLEVVPDSLLRWKGTLLAAGMLPQAINRPISAVGALYRWGSPLGLIAELRVPRMEIQETPPPKWLDRRETNALLREVARSDKRDGAIVALILYAGLRVSEAAGLTWPALTISDRKGELTVVGKGRKRRTVPLASEARTLLAAWRAGAFHAETVIGIGPTNVQRRVAALGDRAAIEGLTPHVLRHTFCRRLAEAGERLETIAALAGHESIETTRRYVEPGADDLARAVEAASALDRPEPPRPAAGRPKRAR